MRQVEAVRAGVRCEWVADAVYIAGFYSSLRRRDIRI